jgi:hypothetical protein
LQAAQLHLPCPAVHSQFDNPEFPTTTSHHSDSLHAVDHRLCTLFFAASVEIDGLLLILPLSPTRENTPWCLLRFRGSSPLFHRSLLSPILELSWHGPSSTTLMSSSTTTTIPPLFSLTVGRETEEIVHNEDGPKCMFPFMLN